MPIDAVFLESLRCELQEQLLACRVDKVQQPERDTILLSMRGPNGGGKLLLTASPNHPRIQLTSLSFENPAQPPVFYGHGSADVIFPTQDVLAMSSFWRRHGTLSEHIYSGMGHSINMDELRDVQRFLESNNLIRPQM